MCLLSPPLPKDRFRIKTLLAGGLEPEMVLPSKKSEPYRLMTSVPPRPQQNRRDTLSARLLNHRPLPLSNPLHRQILFPRPNSRFHVAFKRFEPFCRGV